jgi:hypothetical protein
VRTFGQLQGEHVVASIRTPGDLGPVLFLTVDGRLLRGDPKTLEIEPAANIPQALGLGGAGLRFKAGHQAGKAIVVAAAADDGQSGCLAEWDGTATGWKLIDRAAYAEVCNWGSMSETVVAAGWDRASAILKIRSGPGWITYRLPKARGAYDAAAGDAGSRIREVETERILMDSQGIFYETTGLSHAWFIRPIATHDRVVSDFCSWRGLTVLAGVDAAKPAGPSLISGGPNVAVWAGKTDDLWQFGPPRGQGGPWLETAVGAGDVSEPYLMTNFDHKRAELRHDADGPVVFTILVDPLGTRKSWKTYKRLTVPAGQTVIEAFPEGFAAHWLRVSVDRDCRATAWLVYD